MLTGKKLSNSQLGELGLADNVNEDLVQNNLTERDSEFRLPNIKPQPMQIQESLSNSKKSAQTSSIKSEYTPTDSESEEKENSFSDQNQQQR